MNTLGISTVQSLVSETVLYKLTIDRQLEIVQQLVERLRDVEKAVLDSMEVVAELDWSVSWSVKTETRQSAVPRQSGHGLQTRSTDHG